ncbi:MAG: cytochrome P450 [Bacteroidota bacterium]
METLTTSPSKITKIKGHFLFGNTFDFVKNPLRFLISAMQHEEKMVQIRLAGRHCYLIFRAEEVKYVLQENNKNYTKSDAYRGIQLFLGNGLLNSEGDFWRRQRKLAQPAFHKQRLALLVERMNRATLDMLQQWEAHDPTQLVNISEETMKLTLEIVAESLFSADVKKYINRISASLTTIIDYAYKTIISYIQIPLKYPTPRNIQFKKATKQIDEVVYEIIDSRQNAQVGDHLDLLGMLMEAQDEETGEKMNRQQLRDEVTTIFMAGHETTANALAWAFYMLAKHPDIAQKAREEVTQVLGKHGLPTYENVRELKYVLQVIQETMRLYPPAWVVGRKTIEADQVGEYHLPANSPILMSSYAVHRNPAYWENPDVFNPDNFLPENEKKRPTYAYFPFGGGPRLCIGNNFALMEMQIVLALVIRQFDFHLVSEQEILPLPTITLRPKDELKLKLTAV